MTNTIAIVLGVLIVGALGLDYAVYGSEHLVFLGKKGLALVEWMAFWH